MAKQVMRRVPRRNCGGCGAITTRGRSSEEEKVKLTFVTQVLRGVVLLDDIVDVAHGGADEKGKDEGNDVVALCPDVDVDGVEDE